MINIIGLQKQFEKDKLAVNIPALAIEQGQIVGLVGNNGQGKSTLLKCILDLLKLTDGIVMIQGENVAKTESWKKTTGSYLDESYLMDFMTVEEYFDFIAFLHKVEPPVLKQRLDRFELFFRGEILDKKKYISAFSTGGKTKIGIAAAFLANPTLVLLDEPFAHLDPYSQHFLVQFIKEYAAEKVATFLLSSHQLDITAELSSRVLLMENGKIAEDLQEHASFFSIKERLIGSFADKD